MIEAMEPAPARREDNPFKAILRMMTPAGQESARIDPATPTLRERQIAGHEAAERLKSMPRPR